MLFPFIPTDKRPKTKEGKRRNKVNYILALKWVKVVQHTTIIIFIILFKLSLCSQSTRARSEVDFSDTQSNEDQHAPLFTQENTVDSTEQRGKGDTVSKKACRLLLRVTNTILNYTIKTIVIAPPLVKLGYFYSMFREIVSN